MLVLNGAYTFAHDRARFRRAPAPSDAELVRLLDTLIRRITRTCACIGQTVGHRTRRLLTERVELGFIDLRNNRFTVPGRLLKIVLRDPFQANHCLNARTR